MRACAVRAQGRLIWGVDWAGNGLLGCARLEPRSPGRDEGGASSIVARGWLATIGGFARGRQQRCATFHAISGRMEDHQRLGWVGVAFSMSDVAEGGLIGVGKWTGREESGRKKGKEKRRKGEERRGKRRKKEEREKEKVFGFSKPEYISFSDFRNKILFLRKLVHVFDILQISV